jgi:hypothetical protein
LATKLDFVDFLGDSLDELEEEAFNAAGSGGLCCKGFSSVSALRFLGMEVRLLRLEAANVLN